MKKRQHQKWQKRKRYLCDYYAYLTQRERRLFEWTAQRLRRLPEKEFNRLMVGKWWKDRPFSARIYRPYRRLLVRALVERAKEGT